MKYKKLLPNQQNKTTADLSLNESAVYKTLRCLSKKPATIVSIPLRVLARKAKLGYDGTQRAVAKLNTRGVILFFQGKNQWTTSCFILKRQPVGRPRKSNSSQFIPKNSKNLSRKSTFPSKKRSVSSNVNNVYKNILNNVNVKSFRSRSEEDFTPKDKKDLLALQLAEALDDEKNLGLYLSYCRKYPEEIITRAFIAAKEIPIKKVKRSRGALFTYLVKKYAQQKEDKDFGD